MKFVNTLAIDWYDGIVTGLVRTDKEADWKYCSLLIFEPSTGTRFYGLIHTDRSPELVQKAICGTDWEAMRALEREIIESATGSARIVRSVGSGQLELLDSISVDQIRPLLGQEIDRAIQAWEGSDWRRLFGDLTG